jgi:hypothetical protein
MSYSRRLFLILGPATALWSAMSSRRQAGPPPISPAFPAQDPELAREMVSVAHRDAARVKELLTGRPALAKATWDWGFGDWESALGAASHVGNREIAGLLLAAGAHPTIFSAAMLGHLDTVKAFVAASPGVQKTRGPHGITLLAHAKFGGPGSVEVVKYLEALGDADPIYKSEPLTDAERGAIAGSYAFGSGPTDRLVVTLGERGPAIQREGGVSRFMVHLGRREFHPIGAEAVRIAFASGEKSTSLTITDGPLVVTARRA